MPQTQTAVRGVYEFEAPATETAVLGFRTRANRGGKVQLRFENPITDTGQNPTQGNPNEAKAMTFSVQVAPADANGNPGTFVDTSAALHLEAIVDEVVGAGQNRDYTILLRPADKFVLVVASGSTRGQMIAMGDDVWDRWRAPEGSPVNGTGRFDGIGGMTPA